jgi:2-phosphosulfolactate phosphatase
MPPTRQIDVYLLPALVDPVELEGKAVVVIDVLRATTTIVHALAAGTSEVAPCEEIEDAKKLAATLGSKAVLSGEREGLPIPGFDLGNSPAEFTRDRVAGKTLVFTTTNGTRAMHRCRHAARVLLGAFVNFSTATDHRPWRRPAACLRGSRGRQFRRKSRQFGHRRSARGRRPKN